MSLIIRQSDLEAYLDEALPADEMSQIEDRLREDSRLCEQLVQINSRRDAGIHTVGEIWRRQRMSCPTREQLGSYLLDSLDDHERDYIEFHLKVVGCRLCQASLLDLQSQQESSSSEATSRRKRYYQSSIGHLPQ